MAKAKDTATEAEVKLIIEKYLARREDIVDPIRKVLITLYKGKVNTASEWENIIKSRLERPA